MGSVTRSLVEVVEQLFTLHAEEGGLTHEPSDDLDDLDIVPTAAT
jgi:hypothetical protein